MKYFKMIERKLIYLSPVNPEDYLIYTEWLNNIDTCIKLDKASDI